MLFSVLSHRDYENIKGENPNKANMMWPSQKFLLYNGTIIKIKVNEWINN